MIDNIGVTIQQMLQHRPGPVHFVVQETREFIIDFNVQFALGAHGHHDVV